MTYNSKTVKEIIKLFIEENIDESIDIKEKAGNSFIVNKAIFDLENYLVNLRNIFNLNQRLDTSILSDNILNSFKKDSKIEAFKAIDYEFNFLYHLAESFATSKELHTLIDEFINKFKNQFTLSDIVITASGATRCKTNLRFALNSLRDFSMVHSMDKNNKRSWSPSLIGLITLLNIKLSEPESKEWDGYRNPNTLLHYRAGYKTIPPYCINDILLWSSISHFKQPDYLYCFLTWQSRITLDKTEKKILETLLDEYVEFTMEGLEITENGVRETDKFKALSKQFQQKLFREEEANPILLEKLFKHFKEHPMQ